MSSEQMVMEEKDFWKLHACLCVELTAALLAEDGCYIPAQELSGMLGILVYTPLLENNQRVSWTIIEPHEPLIQAYYIEQYNHVIYTSITLHRTKSYQDMIELAERTFVPLKMPVELARILARTVPGFYDWNNLCLFLSQYGSLNINENRPSYFMNVYLDLYATSDLVSNGNNVLGLSAYEDNRLSSLLFFISNGKEGLHDVFENGNKIRTQFVILTLDELKLKLRIFEDLVNLTKVLENSIPTNYADLSVYSVIDIWLKTVKELLASKETSNSSFELLLTKFNNNLVAYKEMLESQKVTTTSWWSLIGIPWR